MLIVVNVVKTMSCLPPMFLGMVSNHPTFLNMVIFLGDGAFMALFYHDISRKIMGKS